MNIQFLKSGNQIHIKKKNEGKFTDYCGGKVTNACIQKAKYSGNIKLIKRATFALNARKWSHRNGGVILYYLGGGFFGNLFSKAKGFFGNVGQKINGLFGKASEDDSQTQQKDNTGLTITGDNTGTGEIDETLIPKGAKTASKVLTGLNNAAAIALPVVGLVSGITGAANLLKYMNLALEEMHKYESGMEEANLTKLYAAEGEQKQKEFLQVLESLDLPSEEERHLEEEIKKLQSQGIDATAKLRQLDALKSTRQTIAGHNKESSLAIAADSASVSDKENAAKEAESKANKINGFIGAGQGLVLDDFYNSYTHGVFKFGGKVFGVPYNDTEVVNPRTKKLKLIKKHKITYNDEYDAEKHGWKEVK